jgi:hypothetical protein
MRRAAEPVQEALDGIARQEELEILPRLAAEIQEALADRGGLVPGLSILQISDSK